MRSQLKRLTSIIPLLSVLAFVAPFAWAQGVIRTVAGGGAQNNIPANSAELPSLWGWIEARRNLFNSL